MRLLRSFTPLPTACALRLRVISKRGRYRLIVPALAISRACATDFTYSALIPNLDAQDGIRRAGVDSFPVHFGLEDARRVRPPVWG